MRNILLISSIIISLISSTSLVGATTLTPSLSTQMIRQEQVDQVARDTTRILQNQSKLQALRQRLQTDRANRLTRMAQQLQDTRRESTLRTDEVMLSASTSTMTPPPPLVTQTTPPIISTQTIPWVDLDRVRSTWLEWNNTLRRSAGLREYIYESRLEQTAADWNTRLQASRGKNHHERSSGDGYYNYNKIIAWFSARWVTAVNRNRTTLVENVGYGSYSCTSGDCTETLIRSIRSTYDMYLREKSYNGAHYRSMMNREYTKIGIAISVVPSEKRYYMTIHYITDFAK